MTYSEIAEWVNANYDLQRYDSTQDLIEDVKHRFEEDGMYYPNEAGEYINNIWKAQVGIPRQETIEETMERRYEEATRELDEKVNQFFATLPEQPYYEGELPVTTSEQELVSEEIPERKSRFRTFKERVRRFFRF